MSTELTKEEISAKLFEDMWVDESGNKIPPPCTEDELVEHIDNVKRDLENRK